MKINLHDSWVVVSGGLGQQSTYLPDEIFTDKKEAEDYAKQLNDEKDNGTSFNSLSYKYHYVVREFFDEFDDIKDEIKYKSENPDWAY